MAIMLVQQASRLKPNSEYVLTAPVYYKSGNMKKIIFVTAALLLGMEVPMAQQAAVDRSFGINGIIKAGAGAPYNYSFGDMAYKVLQAGNGSIFVVIEANSETLIAKLRPDGRPDTAWGNKGFSATAGISGRDAVMQPDGKIVVAGADGNQVRSDFALIRYNTDGSLDKSFSGDGKQITSFGSFSFANSLALDHHGKIVVAGSANDDFAIARYNPDGSPDNSFSGDGRQTTDLNSQADLAFSVAVQEDGRIIAAGFTWNGSDNDFALVRYNTDGSADTTFGSNGRQTTSFGGNDYAYRAAIQDDGKIIVAGFAVIDNKNVLALARFNIDGSADTSFSGDGKETTDYGSPYSFFPSIAIQDDNKILVGHYIQTATGYDFALSRYDTHGHSDNTFAAAGTQTTDFNGGDDYARAIYVGKEGKIILAGGAAIKGGTPFYAVCRYNGNGSPDKAFGKGGKLQGKLEQGYTVYKSAAVQKDGKIIAAGYTWNGSDFDFLLSRYNTDGSPDLTFNGSGNQVASFGRGDDFAYSVAVQADGKIIAAGAASNDKDHDFAFVRYGPDGEPDKTFGINGQQIVAVGNSDDYANAIVVQAEGKIIAAGLSNNSSAVIRLQPDGSPDPAFARGGVQLTDFGSGYSQYNSVVLQSDGKIIAAGISASSQFTLARYTADGQPDESFAEQGKRTGSFGYVYSSANAIAIQEDGKIVLAGDLSQLEATTGFGVARFNAGGIPDSAFGRNGITIPDDVLSHANSLAILPGGKILVGGSFGNHSSITCIAESEVVDSSFGANGKLVTPLSAQDDIINSLSVVNDKVYAAGAAQSPGYLGTVIKYRVSQKQPGPLVALIKPRDDSYYTAPANIKLIAAAKEPGGRINNVRFYNGAKLIKLKRRPPYSYVWRRVPAGNYTIVAAATGHRQLTSVSDPVHIFVKVKQTPLIEITRPVNNRTYIAPAMIHLEASVKDHTGMIKKVNFYNGALLLKTLDKRPYRYTWKHVPAGTYTLTAVAVNDRGMETVAAPVTVICTAGKNIKNIPPPVNKKAFDDANVSVRLAPNPSKNILNIYTKGLRPDLPLSVAVISASGAIVKTIPSGYSNNVIRVDISSLAHGIYLLKIVAADKVWYRQFAKL